MVILDPYLPDIVQGVVARVSAFFENQPNPFPVAYNKGLYNQVGNDRIQSDLFVWLVMPFEEKRSNPAIYAETSVRLIIAASTDANYSMQQREDINIKPRLLPVYQKLIEEIENEVMFNKSDGHTKKILPYWGGGDVNAPGSSNLWKECWDCIDVNGLKIKIENLKNCEALSSF